MSNIAEAWFLDIIHGILLAGLLVGIWEWADLVVSGWHQQLSRWVTAIGSPLVLLVLTRWGDFAVPYGIYVLVLLAMWYLFSERQWSFLGSLGVLLAMIVTTVSVHGWSLHSGLDIFMMLLAMGVLPRFANYRPVLVYTGTAVVLAATLMFNRNGVSDLIVTVTGAVLLAGYLLGRTRRSRLWALDVDRANHDALTGALTRYGFARWCETTFHGNIPSGLVIVCDLDDFKSVNDTWGHVAGDDILRQFVQRLSKECREQDALVRSGGDEFIVCVPGPFDESKARSMAERLHHAATDAPYQLSVGPLQLGVSMGYAIGPLSDATSTLADQALLVAKRKGKNQVVQASTNGFAPLEISHGPLRAELGWLTDAVRGLWAEWHIAAVLTNTEGVILEVNPAYERVTGRSRGDLVGQKPGINGAGTTLQPTYEDLWNTLHQGQIWEGELENRRPDGSLWRAHELIIPIRLGERVAGYWAMIAEDSTALARTLPDNAEKTS